MYPQQDDGKAASSIILSVLMVAAFVQQVSPDGQIITDTITVEALRDNKLGDPDTRLLAFLSDLFPATPSAVTYGRKLPVIWGAIKDAEDHL